MNEVFAIVGKKPVMGFSKTRLAEDIGDRWALEFYKAFMHDFFSSLKKNFKGKIYFFYTPDKDDSFQYFQREFQSVGLTDIELVAQPESPFFDRLNFVFNRINEKEGPSYIHLTGTDIPDFPFDKLKSLDKNRVCVGPDSDGGFYYFGGSSDLDEPFKFQKEDFKSTEVFELLKHRLDEIAQPFNELGEWSDIDYLEDLQNFAELRKLPIESETMQLFLKWKQLR